MESLALPLSIRKGRFARHESIKDAIDENLSMLISTPLYSSLADPLYGFVFTNFKFEMIDEREGVVCNVSEEDDKKKISGNSRNINTFAANLKDAVLLEERRLGDVRVAMTYIREERAIHITVSGIIKATGESYQYYTKFFIWN